MLALRSAATWTFIDAENLFRQPEPPHALSPWTLNAAMMQHVGQRSYPKLRGCPYGQDPENIGATHAMQVKLHMQRSVSERPEDSSGASLVVAERTGLSSPSVDLYDLYD
jgi:hypothetical protein